jgi:hypothetical protein
MKRAIGKPAIGKLVAIGVVCAVLLTGCGRRAKHDVPAAPPVTSTTSTVTTDTGTSTTGTDGGATNSDVDGQIASTDGLLTDLDDQVNSDAQPAQDAD